MDTDAPMEWQVRMGDKAPSRRLVAVAAMALAGLGGIWLLHHWLFAVIGVAVVFVSTAELFLPVKYRLDANEARQSCGISVTAIRWAEVKRLIPHAGGVRLSPFDEPNRLDAFRGVSLRFASNEDDVLGKIRALWENDAGALERRTDTGPEDGTGGEAGPGGAQASDGDASDPVP